MKKIRRREQEDIMREIQTRATSYTPEWHCDPQKPDIGVALAQVYAGMQGEEICHACRQAEDGLF